MTSGQVNFWPAPVISLFKLFAYNVWTKYARRMKMTPSHYLESNDTQHDLLWPDLISDLRSNFELDILRSNWKSFDLSWLEEHNGNKIAALGPIDQKLVKTNVCAENWCLTSVNFDLWSLNGWSEIKIGFHNRDRSFHWASADVCRLLLFVVISAPERFNWSPALLTRKCENCAMMTSFDLVKT